MMVGGTYIYIYIYIYKKNLIKKLTDTIQNFKNITYIYICAACCRMAMLLAIMHYLCNVFEILYCVCKF